MHLKTCLQMTNRRSIMCEAANQSYNNNNLFININIIIGSNKFSQNLIYLMLLACFTFFVNEK